MSNINPRQIFFTPQFKIDLKKMVDGVDANTERQLRHELNYLLEEIEIHGAKSIHAQKVSPFNDAWFIFFDVINGKVAIYTFVDQKDNIHTYHANRQKTATPVLSLLNDGLKIAKTLRDPPK